MRKVLVADDSMTVRKVAERLLTAAGLEVVLAANGEEALACLERERPDILISDVIMPDKSGYDVCHSVRTHATLHATPVLLISGVVNDDVRRKAESCQADGVLKKAFHGSSLKDHVMDLLARIEQKTEELSEGQPIVPAVAGPPTDENAHPCATRPEKAGSSPAYRISEEQLQHIGVALKRAQELERHAPSAAGRETADISTDGATVVDADSTVARL